MRTPTCLLAALLLAGCGSTPVDKIGSAATSPLADLNVVRAAIPEVLRAAQQAPYAAPADSSCVALAAGMAALDEALGADIDAPPGESPGLLERGADAAGNALQRTAEGVVPFRGWVRKLTGAERYARHVAAAITAGGVRRAFLKGMAQAQSCMRAPLNAPVPAAAKGSAP